MKFLAFVVLSAMAACGGTGPNETDCRGICNAQKNCTDPSFDAADCAEKCDSRQRKDEAYRTQVSACEDCIADRTCVDIGSSCDATCDGLRTFD